MVIGNWFRSFHSVDQWSLSGANIDIFPTMYRANVPPSSTQLYYLMCLNIQHNSSESLWSVRIISLFKFISLLSMGYWDIIYNNISSYHIIFFFIFSIILLNCYYYTLHKTFTIRRERTSTYWKLSNEQDQSRLLCGRVHFLLSSQCRSKRLNSKLFYCK